MPKTAQDYHAACDNDNKEILEKLAADTEDGETANVLRCYTIGQPDKEIRKKLDKFNLPPLKKAATYLGITVDGEVKKLKNDLITEIILRIESLLRDLCGICGDYYNVELNDNPAFRCLICQQGCHQECFKDMVTVLQAAEVGEEVKNSFHFLCAKCLSNYSQVTPTAVKINTPVKDDIVHNNSEPILVNDIEEIVEEHSQDTQTVCRLYRRRECPHGASGKTLVDGKACEFLHPRRCRRYCHNGTHPKYGCTKSDCEYLHSVLCKYSVRNRVCTNLDCKFTHLKFTRRYDPNSSYHNQQGYDQNNSYHNQQSSYQPQTSQQSAYPQQNPHQQRPNYERPFQQHPRYASEYPPLPSNQPSNHNERRQDIQSMPQTVKPPSSDMRFLVEMIQHVKDEFQKELKTISLKLERTPPRQVAPVPQTQPFMTYQPQQMPLHPHC